MGFIIRRLEDAFDPRRDELAAKRREAQNAKAEAAAAKAQQAVTRAARAEVLEAMLFGMAIDPTKDDDVRLKAANSLLDRSVPRVKSIEVQGEVQHTQQVLLTPSAYVGALSFEEALADAMARVHHYESTQAHRPVTIEHEKPEWLQDDDED